MYKFDLFLVVFTLDKNYCGLINEKYLQFKMNYLDLFKKKNNFTFLHDLKKMFSNYPNDLNIFNRNVLNIKNFKNN